VRLPDRLTAKVQRFPEVYLGVWRVTIVLAGGVEYNGVEVAWSGDLIRVAGHESIPFTADQVIDVQDDSGLTG
jgi:hypothetical protein